MVSSGREVLTRPTPSRFEQPLLEVRDLAVCYRSRGAGPIAAVEDMSFDIRAGESVGLLGESGCGKTTLGLAVVGLLPPEGRATSGSIVFQGVNLLPLGERAMQKVRGARISMVHQEPELALNPVLRVGEQIAAVLLAHGASRARSRERARALLREVGFGADKRIDEAYPHQLSGGEKQRVVLAQAIACSPALVIADEPTASLDSGTQSEVRALLKSLQARLQLAIVVISHDPSELEETDRLFVMYAGRLIEEGPTPSVLERPLHPYTRGLLLARLPVFPRGNHKGLLPVIPGEPPNLAHRTPGCAFEPRCPDARALCLTRKPPEAAPEKFRRVECFHDAL